MADIINNIIYVESKELTLFLIFHRLKINHEAYRSFAFILESGTVANSYNLYCYMKVM